MATLRPALLLLLVPYGCTPPGPVQTAPVVVSLSPAVPSTVASAVAHARLVAAMGEPCAAPAGEPGYACTEDGRTRLRCEGGAYRLASTCKGPKACAVEAGKVACDDSVGDVEDPCVLAPDDSNYACSTDATQEIVCQKPGRFHVAKSCRGSKGCYIQDERVHCDQSLARDGEPCGPAENRSCSEDARIELRCAPQLQWAKMRDCPVDGCRIKEDTVYCN
jgi:hypothetical protein